MASVGAAYSLDGATKSGGTEYLVPVYICSRNLTQAQADLAALQGHADLPAYLVSLATAANSTRLLNLTKSSNVSAAISTQLNFTLTAVVPSASTYSSNLLWPLINQLQGLGRWNNATVRTSRLQLSDVSNQYGGTSGEQAAAVAGLLGPLPAAPPGASHTPAPCPAAAITGAGVSFQATLCSYTNDTCCGKCSSSAACVAKPLCLPKYDLTPEEQLCSLTGTVRAGPGPAPAMHGPCCKPSLACAGRPTSHRTLHASTAAPTAAPT